MISQSSAFFKAGKQNPLGTDSCKCPLALRLLPDSSAVRFCQRYPQAWLFVGWVQCPCSPPFALQYLARHERGSSSFLPSFDTFANVARVWFTFPLWPPRREQRSFDNSNSRVTAGTSSGVFSPSLSLLINKLQKTTAVSHVQWWGAGKTRFFSLKLKKINLRKDKIPKTQNWICLLP